MPVSKSLDHLPPRRPSPEHSVSVVIPVRDGEATIERAILSVQTQSSPADQIVVVDDRSTDGTRERVRNLDAGILLLEGEGRGAAAARNTGIARATGAWVGFLDGDDYWQPGLLQLARERLEAVPGAIACFVAATPVDDRGRAIGRHDIPPEVTLEQLIRGDVVPTTSATLVRRDAALKLGGFHEGFLCRAGVEDFDLWLRLAGAGRCVGVQRPSAIYVVHDERDRRRHASQLADLERDRDEVVARLAARSAPPALVRRARATIRTGSARYWLRAGNARRARALALSSLRALPTTSGLSTLIVAASPEWARGSAVGLRRRIRARGGDGA
jgi:glycosyltransferase involved in cell wall biosynthesis